MTADKAILKPGDNLTLTVHYENISEIQIWVPDPVDWLLHGYADLQSGATSLNRWSFDPHSSPKILGPGIRSNFKIALESPIKEPGFLQINLKWGCSEQIAPNPITIECKEREGIEPNDGGPPATRPK